MYRIASDARIKFNAIKNFKRPSPKETAGPRFPTLATNVYADEGEDNREMKKPLYTSEERGSRNDHSRDELCKICRRAHTIPKCSIFLPKNVAWRRLFARFKALCHQCLSHSPLQKECPERKGCTEKDCVCPLSHHSLLHDQSSPPVTNLLVTSLAMEDYKRTFVLLKVVLPRVITENVVAVTMNGLSDSGAISSMITSHLAARLQLQGVSEKVSINTVTHRNHDCELSNVKFQISSTSQDGLSLPVYHAVAVDSLNLLDRYCPDHLDLSMWPHFEGVWLPNDGEDVNEFAVLIGQDVPQVHIVLDYCWGDNQQRQSYGMKTPFGWFIAGPTNRKEDDSKPVALSVFEFDLAEDK